MMTRTHRSKDVQMVDGNEIMDCRNDLIDLMNSPSGFVEQEGRLCKFHPHATLGFSIYFDYDKTKTMAVKVQSADTHDEMTAVWDMHVLAGSLEQFTEMYSKWYKKYKVPHMEASKSGGGDDAVTNS